MKTLICIIVVVSVLDQTLQAPRLSGDGWVETLEATRCDGHPMIGGRVLVFDEAEINAAINAALKVTQ